MFFTNSFDDKTYADLLLGHKSCSELACGSVRPLFIHLGSFAEILRLVTVLPSPARNLSHSMVCAPDSF